MTAHLCPALLRVQLAEDEVRAASRAWDAFASARCAMGEEFTMGEEWIAHEGTGWELVPKAEAPPAPPSRGTMTVTGLDATAITFDLDADARHVPTLAPTPGAAFFLGFRGRSRAKIGVFAPTRGRVDAELALLRPPRNRHERRAEAARARRAGEPCQVMPEHGLACVLGAALLEARGGRGR